jgi:serine/threonine protein phosphatase PrpC
MGTIRHAALSHRGQVRPKNEDRWFADPRLGLYIVSDGMGGRQAGSLAAQIVVETLPALLRNMRMEANVVLPA